MNSAELLRLLEKAITEKEKAQRNYEGYIQDMSNKTLRKLVQGVLQREEGHLEFLHSFRDSLRQQGNLDETILSAEQFLRNSPGNEQQLELLRMIIEGAGINTEAGNQNEIRREDLFEDIMEEVEDVLSEPVVNSRVRQQARPKVGYERSYHRQNRSVVNCQLNNSRSVSHKSR